jgi:hypothetical protein
VLISSAGRGESEVGRTTIVDVAYEEGGGAHATMTVMWPMNTISRLRRLYWPMSVWLFASAIVARPAAAVQPLVTGDVPTADKNHVEIYLGVRYQQTDGIERQLPFAEIVYGLTERQEITFEISHLSVDGQHGFGDAVLGTKYLILNETDQRPGIAGSFELKLDNGDASKGLGTGSPINGMWCFWRLRRNIESAPSSCCCRKPTGEAARSQAVRTGSQVTFASNITLQNISMFTPPLARACAAPTAAARTCAFMQASNLSSNARESPAKTPGRREMPGRRTVNVRGEQP